MVSDITPDYTFHLAAQSYPKTSFDSPLDTYETCLLYTSDAADDTPCVDLGGRRIIKKKK